MKITENPLDYSRLEANSLFYRIFSILIIFSLLFLSSCASEGDTVTDVQVQGKYISFTLAVNGEMSGDVYYCILFNSEAQPIQVDDIGTFTDVIRVDRRDSLEAPAYVWYHRINPTDRILTYITDLTNYAHMSEDYSSVTFTFPQGNTSVVFNNYIQNTFTAQALITDRSGSELGKFIDTLGPDLSSSSQYSIISSPIDGPPSSSLPAGYPNDMLNDCYEGNIPSGMYYGNADLSLFRIYTY